MPSEARLIAAAPDLLEAARLGLMGLEIGGRGKSETANTIRAAIAKAVQS